MIATFRAPFPAMVAAATIGLVPRPAPAQPTPTPAEYLYVTNGLDTGAAWVSLFGGAIDGQVPNLTCGF